MKINRIIAYNAGNYKSLDLCFSSGVTLISGENKVGKSTIIDIIQWALYGNCYKSKKLKYFLKRGQADPMSATVFFSFKGTEWEVFRSYNGKESDAYVIVGGEKVSVGAAESKFFVEENFISEYLLCNSNLVTQKGIGKLIQSSPTERFKIYKKFFGVDTLSSIAATVKEDYNDLKAQLDVDKSNYTFLEDQIEAINVSLSSLKKEESNKNLEELKNNLKEEENKHADLVEQLHNIQSSISSIEKENSLIASHNAGLESLKKDLIEVGKNIVEKEDEFSFLNGKLDSLEKDKEFLFSEKDRIEKEKIGIVLSRVSAFDQEKLDFLREERVSFYKDLESIKSKIDLAEKGKCPTCEGSCSHLSIKNLVKDKRDIEIDLNRVSENILLLEEEKEKIEKILKDNDSKKEKKEKLSQEILLIEGKIAEIESSLVYEKEKEKEVRYCIKSLEEKKLDISKKIEKFEVKDKIDETSLFSNKIECLKHMEVLEGSIKEIKEGISKALVDVSLINEKESEKKVVCKKLEEVKKRNISNNKQIEVLKSVKDIYEKKMPIFMIFYKLGFIERHANDFLNKIDSQFSIKFDNKKDALDIIIRDHETGEDSFVENLSGFEEVIVSLSIYVGNAYYNNRINNSPINWFVVDEPDKSSNDESAMKIFKTLKTLKEEFYQLWIITHKRVVKDFFSYANVLEVKKNFETSYIEELA